MRTDLAEFQSLSAPGASVVIQLATAAKEEKEIHVLGNRAKLLSFANVLLWFDANGWRLEFLSIAELPFVRIEGNLSVHLRLSNEEGTGSHGFVSLTDRGEQFEWTLAEDELRKVGLVIHRLACRPEHEYDRLALAEGSAAGICVRMANATEWLK